MDGKKSIGVKIASPHLTKSCASVRKDGAKIRSKIIAIASAELGVREATGRNDGKRVEEYLAYTNLGKGHEWCAAFVSWCYGQAGLSAPRNPWSPALFPKAKTYWKQGRFVSNSKIASPHYTKPLSSVRNDGNSLGRFNYSRSGSCWGIAGLIQTPFRPSSFQTRMIALLQKPKASSTFWNDLLEFEQQVREIPLWKNVRIALSQEYIARSDGWWEEGLVWRLRNGARRLEQITNSLGSLVLSHQGERTRLSANEDKEDITPADIFGIYGRSAKRINHVGLVKKIEDKYLISIEGNSNNKVESRRRHLSTIYAIADWVSLTP